MYFLAFLSQDNFCSLHVSLLLEDIYHVISHFIKRIMLVYMHLQIRLSIYKLGSQVKYECKQQIVHFYWHNNQIDNLCANISVYLAASDLSDNNGSFAIVQKVPSMLVSNSILEAHSASKKNYIVLFIFQLTISSQGEQCIHEIYSCMGTFVLIFILMAVSSAFPLLQNRVNYDNYKVYRFVPQTKAQVKALSSLENKYPGQVWDN